MILSKTSQKRKTALISIGILFLLVMTTHSRLSLEEETSSSNNNFKFSPLSSATWVNTSITIDATTDVNTTQSGNWTWAVAQDWCSGLGTIDTPYVIENMTFIANPSSNGLLIQNSVGVHFTIQNCTFTNAVSSGYAGLQLDNVDNGTIIGCNVTNNHRGIYFKENCNYNTVAYNDVNISSYVGIDIINNCNYNNISYNTVTHADYSSYDYGQGIYLRTDCNYNYIAYNYLSGNDEGIKLSGNCNENQILNNNASNNANEGIYILSSTTNEIQYNLVDGNKKGIFVDQADENEISFNTIQNNERDGIRLNSAENNTIFNNTLDNNSLIELMYSAGIALISSDFNNVFNNTAFQSIFYANSASNNTVVDNTFTQVGSARVNGMYLDAHSDNNSLVHNTIIGYSFSIKSHESRDNRFIDNTLINGTSSGFELRNSHNSTLIGNVIINSSIGIEVTTSDNTTISENQITGSGGSDISLDRGNYYVMTENTMENKGMHIENIYHNQIDTSNTVGGKSIYYFEDQDNLYLDGNIMTDLAQLFVVNSINSTITNFDIQGMPIGLYVARGVSMNIINNYVSNNYYNGLSLFGLNDSTIRDNIANNNGDCGIYYEGETGTGWDEYDPDFDLISGNNRFTNNSLCYNDYGFEGEKGHHDEISNNIIMNNIDEGMYLDDFYHTLISENQISNNSYGIYLYGSPNSMVIDNEIESNADYGVYADDSVEVTLQSNRINGNSYGIYFASASRSMIVDNDINDNQGKAIYVENLDDVAIKGNTIIGNDGGLYIVEAINCSILENVIMTNQHYGMQASYLRNSTFSGNRIEATNGTGVYLDDNSEENIIYNNRFIDNNIHAEDNGTLNQWFFANLGNYWDNYTGPDADNDGIGDQPYNISGSANSQDLYPMLDIYAPTIAADDDCLIAADSPHTLSWVVADAHPDAYYLTRNGSLIQSPDSWTTGMISYEIAADSLTDGTYVFTLWLNDTFSNQNSASIVVTVDSIPPIIENITMFHNSSVLVNFTVSDLHPGEYSISFNGTVVVPFTTWTNGVITYSVNITDLLPGNYTLAITVRDLVGNENTYHFLIVIEDVEEEQPGSMGVGLAIVYFGVGIAGIVGFVIYRSKRR